MKTRGQATAYGAISILNALATGKGATVSIGLATKAMVELENGTGEILSKNNHNGHTNKFAETVVARILDHYGYTGKFHGTVETSSNIPTAVGLKSSSAAANAIALATVAAIREPFEDSNLLRVAMDASIEAGISLTGAFDDAYSSYYGGGIVADNAKKIIEKRLDIPRNLRILVFIPNKRPARLTIEASQYYVIRELVQRAYTEVCDGKIWDGLTLNGAAYSSIIGIDQGPALAAIKAGAYGAGLSGKGPAIAAVTDARNAGQVREKFQVFDGNVIETIPNFTKASIER